MRASAVSNLTTMRAVLPALLCLLTATTACGDFSQEDLLFLAALPPKESVELLPAGVRSSLRQDREGQALEIQCEEADLRCEATKIAGGFNKITFDLLNAVDKVAAMPPSMREKNRRVWGPHFDADTLTTMRFEMVRSEDGGTFAFCLHAKRGAVRWGAADEVSCDKEEDEKSGLKLLLDGQFTPGDVEGARAKSGVGSLSLHLNHFGDAAQFAERLDIDFDNTDGTQIDVDVRGVVVANSDERRDAEYSFLRRKDNSGLFSFALFIDLVEPVVGTGPERLTIKAAWLADQSGRADASVTEADAPADVRTHQCWDGELGTTWLAPFGQPESGDPSTCSIEDSLLP
jgi:hypothetical protein